MLLHIEAHRYNSELSGGNLLQGTLFNYRDQKPSYLGIITITNNLNKIAFALYTPNITEMTQNRYHTRVTVRMTSNAWGIYFIGQQRLLIPNRYLIDKSIYSYYTLTNNNAREIQSTNIANFDTLYERIKIIFYNSIFIPHMNPTINVRTNIIGKFLDSQDRDYDIKSLLVRLNGIVALIFCDLYINAFKYLVDIDKFIYNINLENFTTQTLNSSKFGRLKHSFQEKTPTLIA